MLLRTLYYELKPILPLRCRLAMRRVRARWLRGQSGDVWPINRSAAARPHGWRGWPGGAQFAFALTHDVEERRGLDRCRALAQVEIEMGFRSAFNFVPEGDYDTPQSLRGFLTGWGFEIGVHDLHHDGKLYRSRRRFTDGAAKINQYLESWGAVGFRSAFMLHNLEWLGDLNVEYDGSTFDTDPFEPQPDGVNTIFPFLVPRGDSTCYAELPCTLPQDSTLFIVLQERTIDIWKQKLDWIAAHGGLALMNVHPDYVSFNRVAPEWEYSVELYREMLGYVRSRYRGSVWHALPRDIARYARHMSFQEESLPLAAAVSAHR